MATLVGASTSAFAITAEHAEIAKEFVQVHGAREGGAGAGIRGRGGKRELHRASNDRHVEGRFWSVLG
ncbi:hypothetical protein, partial [Acinetobacter baumannii]